MARITYGSIITEIAGSIGGVTFQRNASGFIAKRKSLRFKKNTPKQSTSVNSFQSPLQLWSSLSEDSRTLWANFAANYEKSNKWNVVKFLNGYNWFMSINNNLFLVNEPFLNDPPIYESPLSIPDYTVSFALDEMFLDFSPTFVHDNHYLLVYTSPLLSSISLQNRKALRLTAIISPGSTTSFNLSSLWPSTHSTTLPVIGFPSNRFVNFAVCSVHSTKGIGSVFYSCLVEYDPTI